MPDDSVLPARVLVCPDKFKGTLTAAQAAAAITLGIRRVLPDADIRQLPVADGGEGTVDAVLAAGATAHVTEATDPLGRPIRATWASIGDTAVVELAEASGLSHVGTPTNHTAAHSDTYGTGQLILDALDHHVRTVVVGLGGSASTDGGTGILRALGARFLDEADQPLEPGGGDLTRLARVDLSGIDPRVRNADFVLCCDVSSPLLGKTGAAAVFAPQKGAGSASVAALEAGLTRLAAALMKETGRNAAALDWGGAAGGSAAGLHAALGADFRQGTDQIADLIEFDAHLAWADLIVVGEGSLDEQSLAGKAPIGLAERAKTRGVPAVAVSGRLTVPIADLRPYGMHAAASATNAAGSAERAFAEPAKWVATAAEYAVQALIAEPDYFGAQDIAREAVRK